MKKHGWILIFSLLMPTVSQAATLRSNDADIPSIIITEGTVRRDLPLRKDVSVDICPNGCFLTLPNGDRFALKGQEKIILTNGRLSFE